MARELRFVLDEICRVSKELDLDPRDLRRDDFLKETEVTRHDLHFYGGFGGLKADAAHGQGIPPRKDTSASRGVQIRNSYVRGLERTVASQDYLVERLSTSLREVFNNCPINVPKTKPPPKSKARSKEARLLNTLWSDLHYGKKVDPREVLNASYDWRKACRRTAFFCDQAATWKVEHRDVTDLQITLNGDILDGIIHLNEGNIAPITEQIWSTTAILTQAIGFLAQQFPRVSVLCLPGNHDRNTYRGPNRALSFRWDSYVHNVYMGLGIWFKDCKNVTFDIPMSGMGTYQTPGGHTIFATHGDVEPSIKNVGSAFDVRGSTTMLNRLMAAYGKKISAALYGHWHQPSNFMLPNGAFCIVNGSLIGADQYSQNAIGIVDSAPAQVMFESTTRYPVGDYRVVQVREGDNDKRMDSIINLPGIEKGGLYRFF